MQSVTEGDLDVCERAGLPRAPLLALIEALRRGLDGVREATRAGAAGARASRCVPRVEVSAGDRGATILVLDAWWTTDTGADDLLEVGHEVAWSPGESALSVEWFAAVTDHGSVVPAGRWRVRAADGAEALSAAVEAAPTLSDALRSAAPTLAAAVDRLARNGGAWA